jgi:hypothetical protein
MKVSAAQISSLLNDALQMDIGRHLYCVLGTYAQLEAFEAGVLTQIQLVDGRQVRPSVNLNRSLLDRIGDEDLRKLVRSEGKRPQAIQNRLNQEFDGLLAACLAEYPILVLKQVELIFAYNLDMQSVRARAANQNHILLLLPGEIRGGHVTLFTESDPRFHRELPQQLIADNHLWELANVA